MNKDKVSEALNGLDEAYITEAENTFSRRPRYHAWAAAAAACLALVLGAGLMIGKAGRGPRIQKGMAFCVEPMINMGTEKVLLCDDEWTIVTADGKPAANYENTIIITDNGPEMTTFEED